MLRHAKYEDLQFVFGLYMHPDINPYLLYEQMSLAAFQSVYDALMLKNIVFIYEVEGTAIGMCKLVHQEYRNDHIVYLGGVAIHPDQMGKGHGRKMLEEIIALCDRNGIRRIELSTAVTNEKAIRLYEGVGFEKEGIMRKYTYLKSENRFVDEVLMSRIN
ncbi:GNAT family N-acetyltransferase [Flavihumibacter sp.]|uniref:GNAT family N-acetyltransferase n=1 Tax=Flavihumibacter sp. TaxID=1913981 RepID=UPI002FC774A4